MEIFADFLHSFGWVFLINRILFEYTQNILNILMGRSPIIVIPSKTVYDPETGDVIYNTGSWDFVPSRGWEPLMELF